MEHSGGFCPHCGQERLFVRDGVNHLVHAIVTLLLCGLWLPIWFIASLSDAPWRCSVCGNNPKQQPRQPDPAPSPINLQLIEREKAEKEAAEKRLREIKESIRRLVKWLIRFSQRAAKASLDTTYSFIQKTAKIISSGYRSFIDYFKSPM